MKKLKKSKSVKELIGELKKISLLSLDLSYFAVLYWNKEIAKEVLKLEEKVDQLRTEAEQQVIHAAKHAIAEESLIGLLRLISYSERVSDIAAEIAREVLRGRMHEVGRKAIQEAGEKLMIEKIGKEFNGYTVVQYEELRDVEIIAIKRGSHWIHKPLGKFILKNKDKVLAVRM